MRLKALAVLLGGVYLASCSSNSGPTPPAGQSLTAVQMQGSWSGRWTNTTFGSTGAATASVSTNETAKTVQFTLTLQGGVFGGSQQTPDSFTGTYDADKYTVTGTSATFGNLTLTVTKAGVVTGTGTPSRGAFSFTGAATPTTITVNYTIRQTSGSDITGTFVLSKPDAP